MDDKMLRAIDLAEVDLAFARAELSFASELSLGAGSNEARERAAHHLGKVARRLNKLVTAPVLQKKKSA